MKRRFMRPGVVPIVSNKPIWMMHILLRWPDQIVRLRQTGKNWQLLRFMKRDMPLRRCIFLKKLLDRVPVLSNLYLLVAVILGWVLFRFTQPQLIATLMRTLFGLNGNSLMDFTTEIQLQSNMFLLVVAVIGCTPLMKVLRQRIEIFVGNHDFAGKVWNVVFYSILPVILLLLSTACLVGDSYNPFIYFQF